MKGVWVFAMVFVLAGEFCAVALGQAPAAAPSPPAVAAPAAPAAAPAPAPVPVTAPAPPPPPVKKPLPPGVVKGAAPAAATAIVAPGAMKHGMRLPGGAKRDLPLPGPPPPASLQDPRRPHPGVMSAPPPDATPKINNYFKYLKKIVAEEEAKPLPEPRKPGESLTAPQTYPFDALEDLNSHDLIRAVHEGTKLARLDYGDKPQEEIDRQIEANIRFALEYYPIIATDQDAMVNLYYVMEDPHAEPIFRRILFESAVPGRGKDSLFSRYLQEGLRLDPEHTYKMYGALVGVEQESPLIRQLAMENLFAMREADFAAVLAKDPGAKAFREANQRDPQPKDLLDGKTFVPGASSKTAIRKFEAGFDDMVKLFGDLLKPTSPAPRGLRQAIVNLLKRMKEEVPFADPTLVDTYLKDVVMEPAPMPADPGKQPGPLAPGGKATEDALAF